MNITVAKKPFIIQSSLDISFWHEKKLESQKIDMISAHEIWICHRIEMHIVVSPSWICIEVKYLQMEIQSWISGE